MSREHVKAELEQTAALLLEAMAADERVSRLDPRCSLEEADAVLADALELRRRALERFRLMCARLACAKEG